MRRRHPHVTRRGPAAVSASRTAACALAALLFAAAAGAEVVRIEVFRRDDYGTHQRIIGRVHFAVDPALRANRGIADLDRAPTNAAGKVESPPDPPCPPPTSPAGA